MKHSLWWQLLAVFAPLSLLSIGGGSTILADIHKQVVLDHHWLTQAQFLDDFAIARASAGPASVIVTLIGWQIGGAIGAVATTLAIYVPSSLLFYGFTVVWRTGAFGGWQKKLARGLTPLAISLTLASAYSILASGGGDPLNWIVAGAALLALLLTRVNPIVLLIGGGLAFLARGMAGI